MSGKKNKGDSNLNGLLPEQRAQVDRWLFDEEPNVQGSGREVPERIWTADEHDQVCTILSREETNPETEQLGRGRAESRRLGQRSAENV